MRNIIHLLSKRYYKITKYSPKSLKDWKERDLKVNKFLNSVFKNDREEFLNTLNSNLQKGRTKNILSSFYDSTKISYQQHIEKLFLSGWWYELHLCNSGKVYEAMHTINSSTQGCTNKTSLQYAKFLTDKYGKMLFVKPELKVS